jgi:hypothetical protein
VPSTLPDISTPLAQRYRGRSTALAACQFVCAPIVVDEGKPLARDEIRTNSVRTANGSS